MHNTFVLYNINIYEAKCICINRYVYILFITKVCIITFILSKDWLSTQFSKTNYPNGPFDIFRFNQ